MKGFGVIQTIRDFPQIQCILLVDLYTQCLTSFNIILPYILEVHHRASFFRFSGYNSAECLYHCHTCYVPRPSCLPRRAPGKKKKTNFESPCYIFFYYFPFNTLVSLVSNNVHQKITHKHTRVYRHMDYHSNKEQADQVNVSGPKHTIPQKCGERGGKVPRVLAVDTKLV